MFTIVEIIYAEILQVSKIAAGIVAYRASPSSSNATLTILPVKPKHKLLTNTI